MGISASVYVKHNDKPVDTQTEERINLGIDITLPPDVAKDLGWYSQSNTSFKCGNNQVSKKIIRKNTTSNCIITDNSNQTEYTDKEECQKVFKQLVKQYCELDI